MSNTHYIICARNPRSHKLILITEEDSEFVAEFETEHDAVRAACHVPICQAWGYELIEVSTVTSTDHSKSASVSLATHNSGEGDLPAMPDYAGADADPTVTPAERGGKC